MLIVRTEDKRTMNDKSVSAWSDTAMDSFKIPSRQCLKEVLCTGKPVVLCSGFTPRKQACYQTALVRCML